MALINIPRNRLQEVLNRLDQALYNHKEWHRLLIRNLVCHQSSDQHDLAPEPHTQCRFGQWYYHESDENFKDDKGFTQMGEVHKHLHELAKKLLMTADSGSTITTFDYDSFTNSLDRLQLEIHALKHQLEELIYHRDSLTGAISRIDMLPILREQIELAKRNPQKPGCVVMIDLDDFSHINNTYGHPAGDEVLKSVVQYLTKMLRPYDKIFRYGGEEFLLLFEEVTVSECQAIVERICAGLAKLPVDIGKEKINITASFGVTMVDPLLSVDEAIRRADEASYAAKSAGKNCVKIWEAKKDN